MILPLNRLLFYVAVIALPMSLLLATGFAPVALIGLALLLVLALVDALLTTGRLDRIAIVLPEVVRLSRDREGAIQVRIQNDAGREFKLKLGLGLPREIEAAFEETVIRAPDGLSELTWNCTPRQRGRYLVTTAYIETESPLGFWANRTSVPVQSEVRVYPDLLRERNSLSALFLNRGGVGIHSQRQLGKGRDFEKLREYIPGDGYDEIHWKATAKRGHPVTKVFQIERTQEVYVIIDASRLSARVTALHPESAPSSASAPRTGNAPAQPEPLQGPVLERFITSALVLGLAAEHQGDLFGLLTFTNKVETFLRAKTGKAHFNSCREALYTLQPRVVTPDFEEIATFIRTRLRRRALLIVLTALDDPVIAENFVRSIDLVRNQHLVLVNMLKPPGADPVFARPDVESTDDLYQRLGGHLRWQNLRQLEKVLQRRGIRFSLLENERLAVQLVSQYLGVKQRQLL